MWSNVLTVVLVPLIRGVAGWGEKALADGKVSALEWKKLGETVLRIGVPSVALLYGFNLPVEYAVAIPLITDYAYQYIKKIVKAKK